MTTTELKVFCWDCKTYKPKKSCKEYYNLAGYWQCSDCSKRIKDGLDMLK